MSDGHGRSTEGFGIDRNSSVNLIVETALDSGVTDPRQIAYILATAQHESRNFAAPDEDFGRSQAIKLDYDGGEEYFGRGYVHLTHLRNYEKFDNLLGLNGDLIKNPHLAKDPELAAKILVLGMRDGLFTGKRLSHYVNEDTYDLYNARRTVNGITSASRWSIPAAKSCEQYAQEWESKIPALVLGAKSERKEVRVLQEGLNKLGLTDINGRALVENGLYTQQTREAVESFQRQHGLYLDGVAGPETRTAVHLYASVPNPAYDAIKFARQFQSGPHPPINLGAKQVIDGMPDYLRVNNAQTMHTHVRPVPTAADSDPTQALLIQLQQELDALRRQMQQQQRNIPLGHGAIPGADAPMQSNPAYPSPLSGLSYGHRDISYSAPTSSMTRPSYNDPRHPDHTLFEAIRQQLPPGTSDDMAAHVTLQAKIGGVTHAGKLDEVIVQNGTAYVAGKTPGDMAMVDLSGRVPPLQDTLQQSSAFDQQQGYQLAQFHEQQRQINLNQSGPMRL